MLPSYDNIPVSPRLLTARASDVWRCKKTHVHRLVLGWKADTVQPWSKPRFYQILNGFGDPRYAPIVAMLCVCETEHVLSGNFGRIAESPLPVATTDEDKLELRERGRRILDAMTQPRPRTHRLLPIPPARLLVALSSDERCDEFLRTHEFHRKASFSTNRTKGPFPQWAPVSFVDNKGVLWEGRVYRLSRRPESQDPQDLAGFEYVVHVLVNGVKRDVKVRADRLKQIGVK